MKDADIIEAIRSKLETPVGRHLYGVLGSYSDLDMFALKLRQAKTTEGSPFPKPLSVNRGILDAIPDVEFRELVEHEARRPEPTAAHVAMAFQQFVRSKVTGHGVVVFAHLELLFAYNVDFDVLRVMATDQNRILLLIPGVRRGGKIDVFAGLQGGTYSLPANLIAENHIWELESR